MRDWQVGAIALGLALGIIFGSTFAFAIIAMALHPGCGWMQGIAGCVRF